MKTRQYFNISYDVYRRYGKDENYQIQECEKNHGLFRRIVPKGNSFKDFKQSDIDTIFSHINSYPRASIKNKSPNDLFILEYSLIIFVLLNINKIAIKDIRLINYKRWL